MKYLENYVLTVDRMYYIIIFCPRFSTKLCFGEHFVQVSIWFSTTQC